NQYRHAGGTGRFHVGDPEPHRPAAAAISITDADDRLEALHLKAVEIGVLAPVVAHRVEHGAGTGDEGVTIAPVGADVIEIGWHEPALLGREVRVKLVAGPTLGKVLHHRSEDEVVFAAG